MELSFKKYKSKVKGCWAGKNAGGTLGAPLECLRGVFQVDFYQQELKGEPIPNDDLDLQLIWLNAVEKYGRQTDSRILGEYWNYFVVPRFAEYGSVKNNLAAGLVPPFSGYVNNDYRNSNGGFILSEIWACLAPGYPEIAARYAYEDGITAHAGEGLYAEVFCASMESASFVESDREKLIDIGLSYIPENCGVAKGVRAARECYHAGKTWEEARKRVLQEVPGGFGALGTFRENMAPDEPVGESGWDAPSAIGIVVIGLLYGEGDFGKSICIAVNCGEDTDCTAATVGSLLGIIGGIESIPQKWLEPIGESIKTCCVYTSDWVNFQIPKTVDELTERILTIVPEFLGWQRCRFNTEEAGYTLTVLEADQLICHDQYINPWHNRNFHATLMESPFAVHYDFLLYKAVLDYGREPFIREDEKYTFILKLENVYQFPQWLTFRWHLPAGWTVTPGREVACSLESWYCANGSEQRTFTLTPHDLTQARYDIVLEITSQGHHTKGFIPVVLYTDSRENVAAKEEAL